MASKRDTAALASGEHYRRLSFLFSFFLFFFTFLPLNDVKKKGLGRRVRRSGKYGESPEREMIDSLCEEKLLH